RAPRPLQRFAGRGQRGDERPEVPVKAGVGLLALLAAASCARPPSFEQLRQTGYRELQVGRYPAALERAQEGQRRAAAEGDRHWRWAFEVLEAEVKVYQRRDYKEVIAGLDAGLRSEAARDETYARALMARAYALCLSADAKGAGPEGLGRAEAGLDEAE